MDYSKVEQGLVDVFIDKFLMPIIGAILIAMTGYAVQLGIWISLLIGIATLAVGFCIILGWKLRKEHNRAAEQGKELEKQSGEISELKHQTQQQKININEVQALRLKLNQIEDENRELKLKSINLLGDYEEIEAGDYPILNLQLV